MWLVFAVLAAASLAAAANTGLLLSLHERFILFEIINDCLSEMMRWRVHHCVVNDSLRCCVNINVIFEMRFSNIFSLFLYLFIHFVSLPSLDLFIIYIYLRHSLNVTLHPLLIRAVLIAGFCESRAVLTTCIVVFN